MAPIVLRRRTVIWLALACAAIWILDVAAVSLSLRSSSPVSPTVSATATTTWEERTPTAEVPPECLRIGPDSLKPVLTGLVGLGGVDGAQDLLSAHSITIDWAQIDAGQGNGILPNNAIDQAIARAKALGQCHALKIRVMAGVGSPRWVKDLAGGPVNLYLAHDNLAGEVPRFWTEPVIAAYERLQSDLAARYDSELRIEEIVISGCMTFYAEPMLRQLGDSWPLEDLPDGGPRENVTRLHAAGLTAAADLRCHIKALQAHRVWKHTRSSLALNPYDRIGTDGVGRVDAKAALALGARCRTLLGSRCVLANNSIRWPLLGGPYWTLYAGIADLGPPIAFQAAAPGRTGNVAKTLRWALDLGASSVEIVPSAAAATRTDIASLASELAQVPQPADSWTAPTPAPAGTG